MNMNASVNEMNAQTANNAQVIASIDIEAMTTAIDGVTFDNIEEKAAPILARIRKDVESVTVAKATASEAGTNARERGASLFKDVMTLVPIVAAATGNSPRMRRLGAGLFDDLLADITGDKPAATVKAYMSMGRNVLTRVYHERMAAGQTVEQIANDLKEKKFPDVRAMLKPPADQVATDMVNGTGVKPSQWGLQRKLKFILDQAASYGGGFVYAGEGSDNLSTVTQHRLRDIQDVIDRHYNAIRRAKDAETANNEAAKAGATMADNRRENETEASTVETAKPEAQPQRVRH